MVLMVVVVVIINGLHLFAITQFFKSVFNQGFTRHTSRKPSRPEHLQVAGAAEQSPGFSMLEFPVGRGLEYEEIIFLEDSVYHSPEEVQLVEGTIDELHWLVW